MLQAIAGCILLATVITHEWLGMRGSGTADGSIALPPDDQTTDASTFEFGGADQTPVTHALPHPLPVSQHGAENSVVRGALHPITKGAAGGQTRLASRSKRADSCRSYDCVQGRGDQRYGQSSSQCGRQPS